MPPDGDPVRAAQDLIEAGKAADAAHLLERMLKAGRGGLLLQSTLVRAQIAAGDAQRAVEIAREVAALHPGVAIAAVALGDALLAAGHPATAIAEYQRALRLDSGLAPARYGVGLAWLEAGEAEKAREAFAALSPEDAPDLAGKLAEIDAMLARARSDPRHVRHLFDQFSADYDARMRGQLGYGAPDILRGLADLIGISARGALSILDLGCGTGLAGVAFRDVASRLDGIDLSPAMVEKARARGIYDELRVADIEYAFAESHRVYDLVLAADTLVYLGDLEAVLATVARVLSPEGAFLFTVERKDGEGFDLGPKRRWRHSQTYIRERAASLGYDIAGFLECEPRTEAGVPVPGYAVALTLAEKVG